MPKIIVYDAFDNVKHEVDAPAGKTFADVAMKKWPGGFPGYFPFVVGPNGDVPSPEDACDVPMFENEVWTIHLRPTGPLLGVAFAIGSVSFTWLQVALIAVSLIGSYLLRPELPDLSGDSYEFTDDNVQYFSGESNRLRPGSRIQDAFGVLRIYPVQVTEPVVIYSGTSQTVREMYVVTNGVATVTDAKLYDEGVEGIPGTSQPVYYVNTNPWADPNADAVFPIMRSNSFVGGIEIEAPNDATGITLNFDIVADSPSTITASVPGYFSDFPDVWFFLDPRGDAPVLDASNRAIYKIESVSPDGSTITLAGGGARQPGLTQTASGCTLVGMTGVVEAGGTAKEYLQGFTPGGDSQYSIDRETSVAANIKSGGIIYNPTNGTRQSASWGNWSYTEYVYVPGPDGPGEWEQLTTNISNAYKLESNVSFTTGNPYIYGKVSNIGGFNPEVPDATGPITAAFTVPGNTDKVQFDIEFAQGLFKQASGQAPSSHTIQIEVWYKAPGQTTYVTHADLVFDFTDLSRAPRRYSREFKWEDIGETPGLDYKVYFKRLTDTIQDTGSLVYRDQATLIGLKGRQVITPELQADVPNVVYAELTLASTDGSQVLRERKFNVLASRHLPYRRADAGQVDRPAYGDMVETASVMDAILYTLIDQGGYSVDDIDREQLQAVQDELNAIRPTIEVSAGWWHGIVDQQMSVDEQLTLLTRPMRIAMYRRAGTIHFTRLNMDSGDTPRMLINARNKREPETKTFVMSADNEPSVAIVRYKNEFDNYGEASVQYPTGALPDQNAQEQTVLGVTHPEVANRLAQFLYDQKRNERDIAEVTIGPEGSMLAPGDVVTMTDALTQEKPIEGEVISVVGDTFSLDETLPAGDYVATLRDAKGDLVGTPRAPFTQPADSLDVTIPDWSGVLVPDAGMQVGLLYMFVPVTYPTEKDLYVVTNVSPTTAGDTTLSMKQYASATYQSDEAPAYNPTTATKPAGF